MSEDIESGVDVVKDLDNSNNYHSLKDTIVESSNKDFQNHTPAYEMNNQNSERSLITPFSLSTSAHHGTRFVTYLNRVWNFIGIFSQCLRWFSAGSTSKTNDNLKRNNTYEYESFTQSLNHQEMTKNPTLGDSLRHFGLTTQLLELEKSLESVRKREKSIKDHEDCFKEIDKKIQTLSLLWHPDKVKGRGGNETEMGTAQDLQTALNALRTALRFLNSAFIDDIDTDHHFLFYTKLSISSVCDEYKMKEHIFEVILKIDILSQIKQRYIISEIRKFLIDSKKCIRSYLDLNSTNKKFDEFEAARYAAFLHLKYCINGFEKLSKEIQKVKEQCKSEGNDENMSSVLESMANKSERDLKLLQSLESIAKTSLKGKCDIFNLKENMDSYFVLPIVAYTNVTLMCNAMVKSAAVSDTVSFDIEAHPHYSFEISDFMVYFDYLESYCSGKISHKQTEVEMMHNKSQQEINTKEFKQRLKNVSEKMEYKFNVDDYPEDSSSSRGLKKCFSLMTEFQEKEKEVTKSFKEFQKIAEKMKDEREKILKKMEAAEEINLKVQERLDQTEKFNDMITDFLSKQQ